MCASQRPSVAESATGPVFPRGNSGLAKSGLRGAQRTVRQAEFTVCLPLWSVACGALALVRESLAGLGRLLPSSVHGRFPVGLAASLPIFQIRGEAEDDRKGDSTEVPGKTFQHQDEQEKGRPSGVFRVPRREQRCDKSLGLEAEVPRGAD